MNIFTSIFVFLGVCLHVQVHGVATRITLDENAQSICKKYKMMCKSGKICAMQHFDNWQRNITIPVCVPLSFIPDAYKQHVRSLICELPPDPGQCGARYLRWYYNRHSGECSWFTYGGCQGNENNFKYKKECQDSCLGASRRDSALAGLRPSVMTAPVFEAPEMSKYEALNSVRIGSENGYDDRYPIQRQKKTKDDKRRKRRRLNKEKKKRQLRRERKRQKRLLRKKQKEEEEAAAEREGRTTRKKRNKKSKKRGRRRKKNKKHTTTEIPVVSEDESQVKEHTMFSILEAGSEPQADEASSLRHTLS